MSKNNEASIIMTTTNELFLPTRLIYRVFKDKELAAVFRHLRCFQLDPTKNRYTWNFEHEAMKCKFPACYKKLPKQQQPVVLASCYMLGPDKLHVYLRSTFRVIEFLKFFESKVTHDIAKGEFMDEYNFVVTQDKNSRIAPTPEAFFQDGCKIEFNDFEDSHSQESLSLTRMIEVRERPLSERKRVRLTAFYEDGPEYLDMAMKLRETLAMMQHQFKEKVYPFQFIEKMLANNS